MADQGEVLMSFTLGIYKTRAAAEEAVKLWSDVYSTDDLSIDWDGSHYRLIVILPDAPR
jgi:hypothetical protein